MLISVALLVLSFGGLTAVAQASPTAVGVVTPHSGGLTANNPGNQSGNVGIPVSLQLSCSGGFPPCFWTAGGLPPGLTANTAGRISGTPTTAGTYNVTATARDTHNTTSSVSFTWTLTDNLVAVSPGDQISTVGVAINQITLQCFGGHPYCFWSATNLPPGLSIGFIYINGTPTTAGTYHVGLTVKDIAGNTATTSFTWTVNP
ncbi:MAG TPA: Ig domain-containing protein [Pseudonocardiaceae bacterium]